MKQLSLSEMQKPRSRRLRKKLHIGEFKEYGFSLDLTFDKNIVDFNHAFDSLLDFLELNHWVFGGGGDENSNNISGFICKLQRGTLTQEDCIKVQVWLRSQDWIIGFIIYALKDVWHDEPS